MKIKSTFLAVFILLGLVTITSSCETNDDNPPVFKDTLTPISVIYTSGPIPHVTITNGSLMVKLETTSASCWEEAEPYGIESVAKQSLEKVGFSVITNGELLYDGRLIVSYVEEMGGRYLEGGIGTRIICTIKLLDYKGDLIFTTEIRAQTDPVVYAGEGLRTNAIKNFERNVYIRYLGEFVAARFGEYDEYTLFTLAINDPHVSTNSVIAALGTLGDARAIDMLVDYLLEDSNPGIRATSAIALGKIGDIRAVEALQIALNDEELIVREEAQKALDTILQ